MNRMALDLMVVLVGSASPVMTVDSPRLTNKHRRLRQALSVHDNPEENRGWRSGWFPSVPWANTPFDHCAVVGPDRLLFPHPSHCGEGDSFARDGRSPGGIEDLCHGQVRDE